jgi:MOSC domain-containing protein YiiM
MGEPNWIRRFRDAKRAVFYCRVLEPGAARPDSHGWLPGPKANVSVIEMVERYYTSDLSIADVQWALALPIARRSRVEYEAWFNSQAG